MASTKSKVHVGSVHEMGQKTLFSFEFQRSIKSASGGSSSNNDDQMKNEPVVKQQSD